MPRTEPAGRVRGRLGGRVRVGFAVGLASGSRRVRVGLASASRRFDGERFRGGEGLGELLAERDGGSCAGLFPRRSPDEVCLPGVYGLTFRR